MKVEHLDTPVARLGKEIQRYRAEQKHLTYKEIAELCNESREILFPNHKFGAFTKDRIAKIVQAYQEPTATGVARETSDSEAVSIAHALKFSLDDVMGVNFRRCATVWDPLADPEYSSRVSQLLQKHSRNAKELLAWAEFLPCSMVTKEFMCEHHSKLFRRRLDTSPAEWHRQINQYNEIGDRRRRQALSPERTFRMTQLMLISDLERIAFGKDEFAFDKQLRKLEFEYLAQMIINPGNRMELVVAEDKDIISIARDLRDCDSQFVIDDKLTVWRSYGGRFSWSEDLGQIAQNRALLDRFVNLASIKTPQAAHDLLLYLAEMVRDE